MSTRTFEIQVQIAVMASVEVQADSFEAATIAGRDLITNNRATLHTLKRCLMKTEHGHCVQDTEAHMTGVNDMEAGMMYK